MRASGRSTLLTTRITGSRDSSALRSTKRVCGSGPSLASTSRRTPSTIVSPRSTSPPKSAWPGVSTMLSFTPLWRTAVFLARIVMPFSRSRSPESMTRSLTSWFSRNAPDCQSMASTRVVLPWSTWATMATLRRSSRMAVGMRTGLASWVWESPRDPRGSAKSTWPAKAPRSSRRHGARSGTSRLIFSRSSATDHPFPASKDGAGRPDPGRSIHRGAPPPLFRRRRASALGLRAASPGPPGTAGSSGAVAEVALDGLNLAGQPVGDVRAEVGLEDQADPWRPGRDRLDRPAYDVHHLVPLALDAGEHRVGTVGQPALPHDAYGVGDVL